MEPTNSIPSGKALIRNSRSHRVTLNDDLAGIYWNSGVERPDSVEGVS